MVRCMVRIGALMKLREETQMIDLRNTCVLVRTPEENEMLLKEAEKQGFYWYQRNHCEPLPGQPFPDILKFYKEKCITYRANIGDGHTFHEASELLGMKEMTAREFIEHIADIRSCRGRACSECVLGYRNTKRNESLCDAGNWNDNIDELIEIAKSGKVTVHTPEEKAIDTLEKFIENPDHAALNNEFVESLKLAVEKLKEVKK